MAKFFKTFLLLGLFLLISCQEGSEAGDFLGQWRLTGSDQNFLGFSGSVIVFRNSQSTDNQVYGNFQHKGDSLFIQCYSAKKKANDTTVVEEIFGFKPFNNIRMKIVTLDKDHLILSKNNKTWSFEKY
ncbi:MAG: lipocalin-like domain-containing protein [Prevotella sp.]|nr:lipocalin-like domain-containing protein [Prevotella sp.]